MPPTTTIDFGAEELNGMDILHEAATGHGRKGRDAMSKKIAKLMAEGKTQDEAVAIAMNMQREHHKK